MNGLQDGQKPLIEAFYAFTAVKTSLLLHCVKLTLSNSSIPIETVLLDGGETGRLHEFTICNLHFKSAGSPAQAPPFKRLKHFVTIFLDEVPQKAWMPFLDAIRSKGK